MESRRIGSIAGNHWLPFILKVASSFHFLKKHVIPTLPHSPQSRPESLKCVFTAYRIGSRLWGMAFDALSKLAPTSFQTFSCHFTLRFSYTRWTAAVKLTKLICVSDLGSGKFFHPECSCSISPPRKALLILPQQLRNLLWGASLISSSFFPIPSLTCSVARCVYVWTVNFLT